MFDNDQLAFRADDDALRRQGAMCHPRPLTLQKREDRRELADELDGKRGAARFTHGLRQAAARCVIGNQCEFFAGAKPVERTDGGDLRMAELLEVLDAFAQRLFECGVVAELTLEPEELE